ncbi:hypothetical protein nbrc107696_42090 [Gordonia spumicola]|uniref:O-acyltransferase WSD1 C-terminal domain-containing protein n=1 Tax=Gordonia spumicola TaxID=589161 RepID=A0A7I9VF79_9ACTN|nr:hypothetical protein nbrc107696_42090 [Gordonia spumicola]
MYSMAPADAAMYWAGRYHANDQFLLFAFDAPSAVDPIPEIRRRAAAVPDLHLDVREAPGDLDFPRWTPAQIRDDAIVTSTGGEWADVLASIAHIEPLHASRALWRVHVIDAVAGVPRVDGLGRIAILQISHALGDGRRVSAIARSLFGGGPAPFPSDAPAVVDDPRVAAMRSAMLIGPHLARATARGLSVWAAGDPGPERADVPITRANGVIGGDRALRTLTVPAQRLRSGGASVTVGALVGLADVLPAFLGAPRRDASAELTVALDDDRRPPPRNSFQNVGIGLHAHVRDRRRRAESIADEIARARTRASSPVRVASRRAADSAPAVLAAAAARLTADVPPPTSVSGWTVVSSVNRGAADLTLGGGRVRFTAGFPALSKAHALTHGVHGIGDAVTISVHASGPIAADVDGYMEALACVFG